MKKTVQSICLLKAEGQKRKYETVLVPEIVTALLLMSGILAAFRDMMYGGICLTGALLAGGLTVVALGAAELFHGVSRIVKTGIYVLSLLCFLGFLKYAAQGFLDTVNRFLMLWNLRFRTEFEQFAVSGKAAGSAVFWCLLSVPLAAFLMMLVKGRKSGRVLLLVSAAFFAGFVLGRSQMWLSVSCLLAGTFGMLVFSAAPGRRSGIRGMLCGLSAGVLFLVCILATGGYEGLDQITGLREGAADWFEKFRYGEDTLPKGDLRKAPGLLDGEEETLKLDMEEPQEWYLKGFIGGTYDGRSWKELSADAYQGEYEGLLEWLKTKDFSAVTQFAGYNRLTEEENGSVTESVKVQVTNEGAFRKYVYLPSSVDNYDGKRAKEKRDWQVRAGGFFGARSYEFQAVNEAPSADELVPALWLKNPSGEKEETYLGAETVYHSFAEEYYTEVDDELRGVIENLFFPEEKDMDFNEVTTQIRKVLRRETRYTEVPETLPAGQDFVRWFLEDSKRGNAVHYASAAVMAYRTAGYAARYAEGYHISEEDAGLLDEEEKTEAVLTNKNAHAWAEVYFPGAGWLPVEVVPGMYTEFYTNQVVKGAPAYQVNSSQSKKGFEIEGGTAGEEDQKEKSERKTLTLKGILSVILVCMYLCLMVYLVLELQRALRRMIRLRKCAGEEAGTQVFADRYVKEMEQLLLLGKIAGNYNHPSELSREVEEKFAGISCEEYERAIRLLQKVRFGGKVLLPHEIYVLECFEQRLLRALSHKSGAWGRFRIRYLYAL